MVQTFNPEHPAIQAAVKHDYLMYADAEMPVREAFHYPPYWSLARMIVRGPAEKSVEAFAKHLAERVDEALKAAGVEHKLLGPAPAPLAKIRNLYRYHFQMQCPDGQALRNALRTAVHKLQLPEEIQWAIDVDPQDML